MSSLDGFLKRRTHGMRRGHQRRVTRHARPAFGHAFATGAIVPRLATAGAPQLTMPEPGSTRDAVLSNSLSLVIHAAIFGIVALTASFAPEVADQLIEVTILEELPGSNEEPAPVAPRKLAPRRNVSVRAPIPVVTPQAPIQPSVVPRAEAIAPQMAQIDPAAAPTEIEHTLVESRSVATQQAPLAPRSAAVEAAAVAPLGIAPAGTSAIAVPLARPRSIAAGTPVAIATPVAPIAATQVQGLAPTRLAQIAPQQSGAIADGFDTASEFALEDFGAGGGTGGNGTAVGVVRCNESAFVARYYEEIGRRMKARWSRSDIPSDITVDAAVVLYFVLDATGAATDVQINRSDDERLNAGALRAMREASPFPALDDNVRCLVGRKVKGTFKVPARAASPPEAPSAGER